MQNTMVVGGGENGCRGEKSKVRRREKYKEEKGKIASSSIKIA